MGLGRRLVVKRKANSSARLISSPLLAPTLAQETSR
jgi:hypothetical protein